MIDLLRPGGHALLYSTAQQFEIWRRMLAVHPSTQHDCSSSSSTSGSKRFSMVSASLGRLWTIYSTNRNNPLRKSCVLVTVVEFALHLKKNSKIFAEEKMTESCKQCGYASSALSCCGRVTSSIRGRKCDKRVMVSASHSGEREETRKLCPEHDSFYPLQKLVSRFS